LSARLNEVGLMLVKSVLLGS